MKLSESRLLVPILALLLCNSLGEGCTNPGIDGDDLVARESHLRISRRKPTSNIIQNEFSCPDAAAIMPCVCSLDASSHTILDCTDVKSEAQLEAVFQQEFPVKELYEFFMSENNAIRVLGNILNGVTFESLRLYRGPFALEQVSDSFLLSIKDTVTSIVIKDSEMTSDSFPFAIMSQMVNLEYIYIYESSLTWIPAMTAPNYATLYLIHALTQNIEAGTFPIYEWSTDLILHQNQIQNIEPGSFFFADENSTTSSGELVINLSNNVLTSLLAQTFPLRNGPMSIYVNLNQISSIEPGTFILPETTDNLSIKLYLYENLLTTVDEAVLGDMMPFITDLQLFANPLACGCDIAWLLRNTAYMAVIDLNTECTNEISVHDLDPQDFLEC